MNPAAYRAVGVGELSVGAKQFLGALQTAGLVQFSYEPSLQEFLGKGGHQLQVVFLEVGQESRQAIVKLRESGRKFLIVWFGRSFTKEDLAFAIEHRVFHVLESMRMDDRKISEAASRLTMTVERSIQFEQILHALKGLLIQAESEVPKPILAEVRTAVGKLERYGADAELTGSQVDGSANDAKLPFHRSQSFGDALVTVSELERTGVLWVRGGLHAEEGKVGFIHGKIVFAQAGEVTGLKAIYRIFLWDDPRFLFTRRDAQEFDLDEQMSVNLKSITETGADYKSRFDRIRRELPPAELRLELEPSSLHSGAGLDENDYSTLASVVEFGKVSQVINYNPLPDVNLLEGLIHLRKAGLIRVA